MSQNSAGTHSTIPHPYKYRDNKLKGMKQENGTFLYLENIQIEDESYKELGNMVKEHALSVGIRVMATRIITNKYCHDIVGCRIFVPVSQAYQALFSNSWPPEVTCREWEDKPRQHSTQQSSRYKYQENENQYDGYWEGRSKEEW